TGGGPWLFLSSNAGDTPATLNASVNSAGLAPGTYTGSISISAGAGGSQTISVTLVVTSAGKLTVSLPSLGFIVPSNAPSVQSLSIGSTGATNFTVSAATTT